MGVAHQTVRSHNQRNNHNPLQHGTSCRVRVVPEPAGTPITCSGEEPLCSGVFKFGVASWVEELCWTGALACSDWCPGTVEFRGCKVSLHSDAVHETAPKRIILI